MNQEQLKRALTERFSAPLPPHHRRRVIFWKDPDGGFADLAAEIELPGVKKIMLTETNHFLSKLTLCALDNVQPLGLTAGWFFCCSQKILEKIFWCQEHFPFFTLGNQWRACKAEGKSRRDCYGQCRKGRK